MPISATVGVAVSLAALSVGCSNSTDGSEKAAATQPLSGSVGITDAVTPNAGRTATPSTVLPKDVERAAEAFTTAYAEHDARDSKDTSYADAGVRAAKLASGELAGILAQKRPGQDAPWATLRAAKARQSAQITSAVVPDGAPAVTASSALVRVDYVLTTTPRSGPTQRSSEQLAMRLERTSEGWRVTALPWA